MMSLFLGFLARDQGEIRVCEVDPAARPDLARRHIAYIPEHVALYEDMSGLENLKFFDEICGHRRRDTELVDLLVSCGLDTSQAHRRVATYSKGMRQKVGLAIAQAKDAQVLLLDEPMSGLDPSAAREFTSRLNQFKREGKAILMATHDIFRAKECATRIGIMNTGHMVSIVESDTMDAHEIERVYLEAIS